VSGVIEELPQLKRLIGQVEEATSPEQLLGFEGDAARRYWGLMSSLFASVDERFGMNGRNRRPPLDPTNAMLSYGYALLLKDVTLALSRTGLDPYLGMLHTPHHGNPALALDVMEPFRPIVVDSVVLQVIKRGEVKPEDFVCSGQAVAMKSSARKALLRGYERRMSECITHPVFGYRISYRSILSVQARLLSRVFVKEIPELPSFRTR
jgi:CRISPR-associated endonuclease Cas1